MDTNHRYQLTFRTDGDYIELLVLRDGQWRSVTRWMIPGTELNY